jgi:hypothetical protein
MNMKNKGEIPCQRTLKIIEESSQRGGISLKIRKDG